MKINSILILLLLSIVTSCDPPLSNRAELRIYNNTDLILTAKHPGFQDQTIFPGDTTVLITLLDFEKSRIYNFDDFVDGGAYLLISAEDGQLLVEFNSDTILDKSRKIFDEGNWVVTYRQEGSYKYKTWTYSLTLDDIPVLE